MDRWGLIYLFHELDLNETSLENKGEDEIFADFKENVAKFCAERVQAPPLNPPPDPRFEAIPITIPAKSLKERIEEARKDPLFPRRAVDIIDKNKTAAVGHSGPKYTEIELRHVCCRIEQWLCNLECR